MTPDQIQAAAQLIHERFCRAGSAGTCGRCRPVAEDIAQVAGQRALRLVRQ